MAIDIDNPGADEAALRASLIALTDIPIATQTGTSYTLVAADAYKHTRFTNAAMVTVTVPSGVFTVNQRLRFTAAGAAGVTLVASGVTLNSRDGSLVSAGQYAVFEIVCVATNVFDVIGDLA
jgi:hypothetical protein